MAFQPPQETACLGPGLQATGQKRHRVKAERREGSHNHTQWDTNLARTPLHTSRHKSQIHCTLTTRPDDLRLWKMTRPTRGHPHVHHCVHPDPDSSLGCLCLGGAWCETTLQRACGAFHPHSPRAPRPLHPSAWAAHTCPFPQRCSPPAPPHGSRWSPPPSVWTVQPGHPCPLSHRSASHHLWVACGAGLGPGLSSWHGPCCWGQQGAVGLPRKPLPSVRSLGVPDTPPVAMQLLSAGLPPHPASEGGQPPPKASAWLFRAP